ncbi:MAG: 2-polyprenyl-6-methoxyphenol hydroxylase [Hyphomicrobiales bacterium]|nr:MAG: 2-polyprenyl-6-methoxyphenol hydroxylase [Hyphomicrobiales bacterium]
MGPKKIVTKVAIVGAGPVGLSLAIDLGSRGVDCVVLEQGNGHVDHPRAGLMSVRTMELFRHWGISEAVRTSGFPDDFALSIEFCTSISGHTLARDEYPSIRDMPLPSWSPEKKQRCPQHWLDPVLKRALRDRPRAAVLYGTSVEDFVQDGQSVTVVGRNTINGEAIEVHADYLVGCDGASSVVRSKMGISMEGKGHLNYSMSVLFSCPDLLNASGKAAAERFLLLGPEGTWGNLTVIDGREVWRLTVYGNASKFDMEVFNAAEWVKRALGSETIPFQIISMLPWKRSELVAKSYHLGRVLIAGDAAHTMSPTGGMGMNTGLGDVFDLGWKLQALVQGWGGPELLPSYTAERRPIAERNAAYSTKNYATWVSPPPCPQLLDDTVEAEFARKKLGQAMKQATQYEWQSWGLQMGYRYESSPICICDGTDPTPDDYSVYVPSARPGSRAPHFWLGLGRSVIDLFGSGFVLLDFDGRGDEVVALADAAEATNFPLTVHKIRDKAAAILYEAPLVLVRPDGHVAWRGSRIIEPSCMVQTVSGNGCRALADTEVKVNGMHS